MSGVSPELCWGIFVRLLGGVYLLAFLSVDREVLALAGARGIAPMPPHLARIRRDFGWRRWFYFPSLLWLLGGGDRALRGLCWLGAAAALASLAGGAVTRPALLVCYLAWLSLDLAADLIYPWDSLLFEAGLLALFLPEARLLPSLSLVTAPHAAIAWGYQCLLFRCVIGFGKYKFFGPRGTKFDWAYLHGFLSSQPLPTPLGFRAGNLPLPLLKGALAGLFVVEMIAPVFLFVPGAPRLVAAALIFSLMIGIQLCGNFGYFNVIVALLCVPMLDAHTSIFAATRSDLFGSAAACARTGFAALLLVLGLVNLPFNSWISRAWAFWPSLDSLVGGALRPLLWLVRASGAFRVCHPYGVFGPESGPPVKWVPIIEGTRDGVEWRTYPYRYMPSDGKSRPRFIAPFCPRIDHFTIYDAYGIRSTGHFATTFGFGHPYRFSRAATIDRLMARLLDGSPEVLARFREDPFAGEGPPIAVRARLFLLLPATPEHIAATGEHWLRRPVAPHTPELRRAADVFGDWLREPALFHPDDHVWAQRAGEPRPPATDELALLWRRFVPYLRDTEAAFCDMFSRVERDTIERTIARLTRAAALRLPPTLATTTLHDHLALLDGLTEGEAAFAALCRDPAQVRARATDEASLRRGLALLTLFWHESLAYHARKARLRDVMFRGAAVEIPPVVPGFLKLLPLLARHFPASPDERVPTFERGPDGCYHLLGDREPGARITCAEPLQTPDNLVSTPTTARRR